MTKRQAAEDTADAAVRIISWRLLPLLGLVYLIAYIDRQNVSFAKLQMAQDLGLSEAAFGLGASLFFIGYFLFEVPSNLMLARVGAGAWFARIMASWGAVTVLLAFTSSGWVFYLLRFLLGAAEAGLFPGVLYALTLWFPARYRGRAIGMFMIASAVANAVGAALGGVLLDLDGVAGLRGWQWVFIVTGLPAIALAPAVYLILPSHPERAGWLSGRHKAWLAAELAAEHAKVPTGKHAHGLASLADRRVAMLCITFFGLPLAAYGLSYWLPTIVRDFGVSNTANGLLNALLWIVVGAALWLVPRHAARHSDQRWHIIVPPLIGAIALVLCVLLPGFVLKFAMLCIAAAAIFAGQPIFWTLPPRFLTGAGAAAGFAAINSVGNLGGFAAQAMVPAIATASDSKLIPMLFLAGALVAVAGGVMFVERRLPAAHGDSS